MLKKNLLTFYIVIFLIHALVAQEINNINGKVIDTESGKPLENVTVTLRGYNDSDITGADGIFFFEGFDLNPGDDVLLDLQKDGYCFLKKEVRTVNKNSVVRQIEMKKKHRKYLTIILLNEKDNKFIEKAEVKIGTMVKMTDEYGQVIFDLTHSSKSQVNVSIIHEHFKDKIIAVKTCGTIKEVLSPASSPEMSIHPESKENTEENIKGGLLSHDIRIMQITLETIFTIYKKLGLSD